MNGELLTPPSRKLPAHRLALRRGLLLDEIRSPEARANVRRLQRAWRLGPRRTRLVLVLAIFVVLAVAGTAVGIGINLLAQQERFDEQRERIAGEPKRIGPLVEITSGPGWSLVAWRSDSGICLDFVVPTSSSGACGFGVRGESDATAHNGAPLPKHWISGGTTSALDTTVIDGVVAEEVARVEVVLGDGRILDAPVIEAPPELQANVDFFLLRLPADSSRPLPSDFTRVFIAYNEERQVLERRG
jgi:hypothetical protein